MFIIIHSGFFIKNNIVNDFKISIYSFNNLKLFSTIIKMLKPYEVKKIDNTIKTTITNIIEFDFFRCNRSIYKNTIEVIYILKISINLISIRKFQFNNIIYNGFNRIIMIESIGQKVAIFIWIQNIFIFYIVDIKIQQLFEPTVETLKRLLTYLKIFYKTIVIRTDNIYFNRSNSKSL